MCYVKNWFAITGRSAIWPRSYRSRLEPGQAETWLAGYQVRGEGPTLAAGLMEGTGKSEKSWESVRESEPVNIGLEVKLQRSLEVSVNMLMPFYASLSLSLVWMGGGGGGLGGGAGGGDGGECLFAGFCAKLYFLPPIVTLSQAYYPPPPHHPSIPIAYLHTMRMPDNTIYRNSALPLTDVQHSHTKYYKIKSRILIMTIRRMSEQPHAPPNFRHFDDVVLNLRIHSDFWLFIFASTLVYLLFCFFLLLLLSLLLLLLLLSYLTPYTWQFSVESACVSLFPVFRRIGVFIFLDLFYYDNSTINMSYEDRGSLQSIHTHSTLRHTLGRQRRGVVVVVVVEVMVWWSGKQQQPEDGQI